MPDNMVLRLLTLLKIIPQQYVNLTLLPEKQGADLRSLGPVHACICGCQMFSSIVMFEDYELAWWSLDGECVNCGALVTLPCPVDKI